MFQLLIQHKHFYGGTEKELCPEDNSPGAIWLYFEQLAINTAEAQVRNVEPIVLVNGCIQSHLNIMVSKLLRGPQSIYIVLTRNYADLLWAAYNFWCNPLVEVGCVARDGAWANQSIHYRSPENFHDIVISWLDGKAYPSPLNDQHEEMLQGGGFFEKYISNLLRAEGIYMVIVFADDQLRNNASDVWHHLTTKARLGDYKVLAIHKNLSKFNTLRVNTGARR